MKDLPFSITCPNCLYIGSADNKSIDDIKVYFRKGSPNTMDRMAIYCGNCGYSEEHGITWQLEVY